MEHTYYYDVYVYDNVHHVYTMHIGTLQQTEIIISDYLDFGWKCLTIIL